MISPTDRAGLPFNPAPVSRLHVDLNAAFASIEQQANPFLRGRPVAVAAYTTPSGCIVAPSVEAKRYGIRTGMRVKDGRRLCPDLVILPPDPDKYRDVHLQFRRLLAEYTDRLAAPSIDEFALDLTGLETSAGGLVEIAQQIKRRILDEIGDWLRVSVGIGPNRFLAKQAAGLKKPDGLDVIDAANYQDVYARWELTDLSGINTRYAARLHAAGIHTVTAMAAASDARLRSAFGSILGHYWFLRLRGWEIDDVAFPRRSYGAAYSLPQLVSGADKLAPVLTKLVEKATARMRRGGYHCHTINLAVSYRDGNSWHQSQRSRQALAEAREITRRAYLLLCRSPYRGPVRTLSVACGDLVTANVVQRSLFDPDGRRERLVEALDTINTRLGPYTIAPAAMLAARENVPDRISFGAVADLQDSLLEGSASGPLEAAG